MVEARLNLGEIGLNDLVLFANPSLTNLYTPVLICIGYQFHLEMNRQKGFLAAVHVLDW